MYRMGLQSLCGRVLLGLSLSLLLCSLCIADDKTINVVGFGECADCKENNINTIHALSGLHVSIDCKLENGEIKTRGEGELDKDGKFEVSLPKEMMKDGKLKEECYAQLHSASAAPCPAHNGIESSKIVTIKADGKHTLKPAGNLKFSTPLCTSAFLWPYFKYPPLPKDHPWMKKFPNWPPLNHWGHPFPLPPIFKKPCPPPVPVYNPTPEPPVVKPLPPPVPVYNPTPEPPVVKPLPPPVPVYKPKPIPPPVPVYKPKPKPPPVPVYKPKPKPPVKKPCPPSLPKPKPPPVKKPCPPKVPKPKPPPVKKPCPPKVPKPKPHPVIKPCPPKVPIIKPLPPSVPVYKPPVVKPLPPPVPIYKKPCPPLLPPFHHHKPLPPIVKPLPPVVKPLPPPVPIYKKPCPPLVPFPKIPPFHHPLFPPLPPKVPHP